METLCECCVPRRMSGDCLVMRELRLYRTPEGRKQLLAEYYETLRRRGNERATASTPAEAWSWAQKSGAPYDALKKLRYGPEESVALTAAKEFNADPEALFLLLLGPTGVGKTLAASLVVVDFCGKYPWNQQSTGQSIHPVEYADAAAVARLSVYGDADKAYVDRLRNAHLLVLEDMGDEGTELGKGLLVEVLMHRHASRRRTVLTSNLTKDPFKARYGQAVADRIRSSGIIPNLHGQTSRRPDKDPRP